MMSTAASVTWCLLTVELKLPQAILFPGWGGLDAADAEARDACVIEVSDEMITAKLVVPLSIILHEMGANAQLCQLDGCARACVRTATATRP